MATDRIVIMVEELPDEDVFGGGVSRTAIYEGNETPTIVLNVFTSVNDTEEVEMSDNSTRSGALSTELLRDFPKTFRFQTRVGTAYVPASDGETFRQDAPLDIQLKRLFGLKKARVRVVSTKHDRAMTGIVRSVQLTDDMRFDNVATVQMEIKEVTSEDLGFELGDLVVVGGAEDPGASDDSGEVAKTGECASGPVTASSVSGRQALVNQFCSGDDWELAGLYDVFVNPSNHPTLTSSELAFVNHFGPLIKNGEGVSADGTTKPFISGKHWRRVSADIDEPGWVTAVKAAAVTTAFVAGGILTGGAGFAIGGAFILGGTAATGIALGSSNRQAVELSCEAYVDFPPPEIGLTRGC